LQLRNRKDFIHNASRYFDSEGWKRLVTYEGSPEKGRGSKRE
jgi:hypothetical protein